MNSGQIAALARPIGRVAWRVLAVAVLAAAVAAFLRVAAVRHGFFDLKVYYGAINYWAHNGGSLYDYILPRNTYGFTYPPFAALVMLPMAVTPWPVATLISATASVAVTLLLLYWLVDPISRRQGWRRWFVLAIAACLAAAFEPVRETVSFGQVNTLLAALVAADLLLLVAVGSRFGGIGIGLATAIKLTPGIFVLYLQVTRRWRAAGVAIVTAAVATIAAAAVAPTASRIFWTDALWNTDRVGELAFVSNQSLQGAVARLDPSEPSKALWLVAVLVVAVIWFVRVRRARAGRDEVTGMALTGVLGCLMSPVTWVHHLVWLGPALILVFDRAFLAATRRRRWIMIGFCAATYVLLCSRLVWQFSGHFNDPVGWFVSNAYVWASLALLLVVPVRRPEGRTEAGGAEAGEAEAGAAGSGAAATGPLDQELVGLLDHDGAAIGQRPRGTV